MPCHNLGQSTTPFTTYLGNSSRQVLCLGLGFGHKSFIYLGRVSWVCDAREGSAKTRHFRMVGYIGRYVRTEVRWLVLMYICTKYLGT